MIILKAFESSANYKLILYFWESTKLATIITHWEISSYTFSEEFESCLGMAIIECIVHFFEENPAATFKEMLDWAQNNHLPKFCIGTLHSYLETEVFTRKQLCLHPQERNSEKIKIMWRDQAKFLLHNQQYTFVFIDEYGFNLSTQRRMGRSKRAKKAIMTMPLKPGANISVYLAIDNCYSIFNKIISNLIQLFQI